MQQVGRHRLVAASALGLAGDRRIAELLVEDHAGDQHDADADGDRQFGADADVEPRQHGSDVKLEHRSIHGGQDALKPNR